MDLRSWHSTKHSKAQSKKHSKARCKAKHSESRHKAKHKSTSQKHGPGRDWPSRKWRGPRWGRSGKKQSRAVPGRIGGHGEGWSGGRQS